MTSDQMPLEEGAMGARLSWRRKVRRWLLVLAGVGVPLIVGGAVYIRKDPCPYREAPLEIRRVAIDAAYPDEATHSIIQGSKTTCALCELDSWLCPVDGCRRLDFMSAVVNSARHETYYVFAFHNTVDVYLVYIVKDGLLMPQNKFECGGA